MGMRANYVIKDPFGYKIYYSHWGAEGVPYLALEDPRDIVESVKTQREVKHLLDNVWAEGGLLIDLEKKALLVFGNADEESDLASREVLLFVANRVWEDWDIRWADDGTADIADYIGYPRSYVICEYDTEYIAEELHLADEALNVIGSFRFPDGSIYLYPLEYDLETYLEKGPELLSLVDRSKGVTELDLKNWRNEFPCWGGFHIDIPEQTLNVWTGNVMPDYVDMELKEKWQGWKINWHYSDYRMHEIWTKGKLKFPTIDVKEAIAKYIDNYSMDLIRELLEREKKILGNETSILLNDSQASERDQLVEMYYVAFQKSKGK
jgi:hypothetical protein